MIEFNGTCIDAEEAQALEEFLIQMRAEKARQRRIEACKSFISFAIGNTIAEIGLCETKRIVRELHTELKRLKTEDEV